MTRAYQRSPVHGTSGPSRRAERPLAATWRAGDSRPHGYDRAHPDSLHRRLRHAEGRPIPAPTLIQGSPEVATGSESKPRRVLVATDTSKTSAAAEQAGIELAARTGASMIFLSVIDPSRLQLPGGLFHTRVDQDRASRELALAKVVDNARRVGVAAQFLIWQGDPGASIVDAAEAEGADVIVVGSHDRGPVGRLLLGSVSSYVVDHGGRPVLVIRPDQQLGDVWPRDPST